jgi:hypothetical protein
VVWSTSLGRFRSRPPEAVAGEVEAVGVVDEAVEDGVGVGWVADHGVPILDGELTGDDGRAATVAFLEDFEEVVAGLGIERLEPPIIEDEELDAAQRAADASVAPVAAGERQVAEELWHALIEDGAMVAASLVTERAGKPALAGAGRSSVILPGVRRLRFGFFIRFIRATVRRSWRSARCATPAPTTSSSGSRIGRSRFCRSG